MELERGEFTALADQLECNVYIDSPGELMESLTDGWWLGFRWRVVAKLLFVQNRLLVEDGWKVPRCFFKYLVENALRLEETREPPASSSEDLQRLLFEGAQWLCKKLPKVTRRPCVVCGKLAHTLYRPCVRRSEARPPLSQVYCSQCFPLEEDSAQHSTIADIPNPWGTDDDLGFVHQDVTIETSSPASSSDSSDHSADGEGHGDGVDLSASGCSGSFKDSVLPTTPGTVVAAVCTSPPRECAMPLLGKRECRWILDGSRWVLAPHAQPVKTRAQSPVVPRMDRSMGTMSQSFQGLPIYLCLKINSYLAPWIDPSFLHRVPEGGPVVYPLLGRCRAVPFIEMWDARFGARAANHAGADGGGLSEPEMAVPAMECTVCEARLSASVCRLALNSVYTKACPLVIRKDIKVTLCQLRSAASVCEAPLRKPLAGDAPVPRSWWRGAGPATQRAMLRRLRGLGWGPRVCSRAERQRRRESRARPVAEDPDEASNSESRDAVTTTSHERYAAVVDLGDELDGYRSKCLQLSLLHLAQGARARRMREMFRVCCGNHSGSGGNTGLEHRNMVATQCVLEELRVFVWVVGVDSRAAWMRGLTNGKWKLGHETGQCLGSVMWVLDEEHVCALDAPTCVRFLAAVPEVGQSQPPPWFGNVVGMPKDMTKTKAARSAQGTTTCMHQCEAEDAESRGAGPHR